MAVDKYPGRGGDGYILDSFDVVGGCAVNIAMTVKKLGGEPYIVSSVGNDRWGSRIMDYMRDKGLSLNCVNRIQGNTGYCFVFLEPDGERTFLTRKGCETEYSDELIPDETANSCSVAAVTGYYLLDASSGGLLARLNKLKDKGCKIVFDPSPLVDKIDAEYLREILALSDIIVPNGSEAAFITGFAGKETPEQWAFSCNERSSSVIIKQGSAGGILFENGRQARYEAANADVIDTTGAGDSFTGAIAYALGTGLSLEEGVAMAALEAGRVVSIEGPH